MRNEHKSRAGKYDHVKPLPYKRFHPEVLKVIHALLFAPDFANRKCKEHNVLGEINTKHVMEGREYLPVGLHCMADGVMAEHEINLISGLQRVGYNYRKFPRLLALVGTRLEWVRMRDLYPLVEADLREQGVLGRKREPLKYCGTGRVTAAGSNTPNIQQIPHNTPEAQRVRTALTLDISVLD